MSTLRFLGLVAAAFVLGFGLFAKPAPHAADIADSGTRTYRAEFAAEAALARDINSALELSRQ